MSLIKKLIYRKLMVGALVSITLLTAPGCNWGWVHSIIGGYMETAHGTIKKISAEDLSKKMKDSSEVLVVNVLSKKSFDDCRIKGSSNVAVDDLEDVAKKWEKDQEIIVYCASYACNASRNAYAKLKKLGFTNIFAYEGGMKEWREKELPSTGPCEAEYLK